MGPGEEALMQQGILPTLTPPTPLAVALLGTSGQLEIVVIPSFTCIFTLLSNKENVVLAVQ